MNILKMVTRNTGSSSHDYKTGLSGGIPTAYAASYIENLAFYASGISVCTYSIYTFFIYLVQQTRA
jgi:hypothetical protein